MKRFRFVCALAASGRLWKTVAPLLIEAVMPALDDPIIDRYLDALWLEKGLADNSREAYRSDLALFNGWLEERGVRLATAGREIILDHLAWRLNNGYKARSTARFLSGLRGFYRYLLREGEIAVDPTLRVDLPRLGRPLPKALSEADVEALLTAPDIGEPLGLRDRAMLEVLYACGLRVTELISLTLEQVSMRQGVVRTFGKGNKERLVPLGDEALHWLERYQRDGRELLLSGKASDVLFPSQRGGQIAPRFRHALAQPWRGSAHRADVAWSQRPVDHSDLHPHCASAVAGVACGAPSTRLGQSAGAGRPWSRRRPREAASSLYGMAMIGFAPFPDCRCQEFPWA